MPLWYSRMFEYRVFMSARMFAPLGFPFVSSAEAERTNSALACDSRLRAIADLSDSRRASSSSSGMSSYVLCRWSRTCRWP